MIALTLCLVLGGEPDALPADPVYQRYAKRCAAFTAEKKEEAAKTRAECVRTLNEARKGIIAPGTSDGGDHIRSWSKRWVFESAREKQEYVAQVRKNIKTIDDATARMRNTGRYIPAPLPIPARTDDMGRLYDPVMVVSVEDASKAIIRVLDIHFVFHGECRDMKPGREIAMEEIVRACGREEVKMPGGRTEDIMALETVDGIGLRAYLMEAMPELKK